MPNPNNLDPKFQKVDAWHGYGICTTCRSTNGTTRVNFFGSEKVGFTGTITGVWLIAKGGTAANITLTTGDAANVVCTIAKGTTTGALVGASSLSNTTISGEASMTIISGTNSSECDAYVFVTYKS